MDEKNGFGAVDYSVFAGVLVISSGIGLYISYKGSKSPEEFLMGNRSLKPFAVSMSLLTSYITAFGLVGYSGEAYANGMQISTLALGCPLAIMFSSYFILPILYPLKLTSINEYIELRFKSKRLRFVMLLLTVVQLLAFNGISLYSSTIALSFVTEISILSSIFILGIICTLYSSFGGIKAVIWTDVFQFSVIMIGMITVMAVGCAQNGGFIETLHIASKGGRLEVYDFNPSPFVRHTVLNTIGFGFFFQLRSYSSEQVTIQRICTVKTIKNARSVLTFNIYGKLFTYFLMFTCGLVAYATYVGCDPMALGLIKKKDQIVPYFVMDKLSFVPGLPGLFVAAIIGGSLSTLSSGINACVAMLWKDIFLHFDFFKEASQTYATIINKIISLIIGAAFIAIAILTSKAKGVLEIGVTMVGTFGGPILGIFLIGYFFPRCNIKSVWAGFITSYAVTSWLALGGLLYRKPTPMLPFSADECVSLNISSVNISIAQETISSTYSSNIEEMNSNTSFVNSLYQISYTLYGVIGPILCILLAVVISCITGNQKIEEVSPKYVCPHVHKFYWTKDELHNLRKNEFDLDLHSRTKEKENPIDKGIDNNCFDRN